MGVVRITATYATTQDLSKFMNIWRAIPDPFLQGESRLREEVGTGDSSNTRFFLDHAGVIASTYTISYGASESSVTALTETTHYTLDKDAGEITLTSAGVTAVGTNKIFAKYWYLDVGQNVPMTDTMLADALDQAQQDIDDITGNHWANSTDTTPDWNQSLDEKHTGKGKYDRAYYSDKFPIANVSTTLNGAVTADDATITVDSTSGFPSSGYLTIGSDKIQYTGKTSTTFTGCTSVSAHDDGDSVYSWVVEISTTESGTSPSWTVLSNDSDYDIDFASGRVYLHVTDYDLTYYALQYPLRMLPNRFRMSYVSGKSSIPSDIKRLCVMMAARDLMHGAVRRATVSGSSEFRIDNVRIDDDWIDSKLEKHTLHSSSNV